jgi:uncharacterized OB-fold protein
MGKRPLPVPDSESGEFWEQASKHVLVIQRCDHCGNFAHPPVTFCSACHRLDRPSFHFESVSGRGELVSWTIIEQSLVSGFEQDGPITNALVRLEEQDDLFMMATVQSSTEELSIGHPVVVDFADISPNISLPMFRLVKEAQ